MSHVYIHGGVIGIRVASIGEGFCVVGSHLIYLSAKDMRSSRNRVEIGAMLMPWMGLIRYGGGGGGPWHQWAPPPTTPRRGIPMRCIYPIHRNSRATVIQIYFTICALL